MSMLPEPTALADPQAAARDRKLIADALAPAVLPPPTLEQLTVTALIVDLPAGSTRRLGPDWPVRALWLLRKGEIALGGKDRRGEFSEMRRVLPGEWLDVFGALGAEPTWFHEMQVLRDSEALALPLSTVMQLICADPEAGLAFGQLVSTQASQLRDGQSTLRNRSFAGRLASRLLDETSGCVDMQARRIWTMGIRKQHLAQQLDVSSETLSRGLRALCEAGVIEVRGYDLEVMDTRTLVDIARSGCLPGGQLFAPNAERRLPSRRSQALRSMAKRINA